jgi:hypothetical protein
MENPPPFSGVTRTLAGTRRVGFIFFKNSSTAALFRRILALRLDLADRCAFVIRLPFGLDFFGRNHFDR